MTSVVVAYVTSDAACMPYHLFMRSSSDGASDTGAADCGTFAYWHAHINDADCYRPGHLDEEQYKKIFELAKFIDDQGWKGDGVLIWNWLKDGTPEQAAKDRAEGLQMLEMLMQHGGGPMHAGSTVALDGQDGEFENIVAMYYPGREFLTQLLRSEWMHRTVKGKSPGDSLAVMTIPFRARAEAVPFRRYGAQSGLPPEEDKDSLNVKHMDPNNPDRDL